MSRLIRPGDAEWPAKLTEANAAKVAPPIKQLRAIGLPLEADAACVAIVGTRRASASGLDLAHEMAGRLAEAGFVIVSGMALGIDGAAHRGALDAAGRSVAVLGCGADVCYPPKHRILKQRLQQAGTIVSEYPDGAEAQAWHFPERNRIIAALSLGVIVIQGGPKSGALITARLADRYNRAVFAVPGNPLVRESFGCHQLIRSNLAALVTSVEEVLEELAPRLAWADAEASGEPPTSPVPRGLSDADIRVMTVLDDIPRPPVAVAHRCEFTPGEVALACARLEVRGLAAKRMAGFAVTPAGIRVRNEIARPARRSG
jgi:DNA processing protein